MTANYWHFTVERLLGELGSNRLYLNLEDGWVPENRATPFRTHEDAVEAALKTDASREQMQIWHCSPVISKEAMFDLIRESLESMKAS